MGTIAADHHGSDGADKGIKHENTAEKVVAPGHGYEPTPDLVCRSRLCQMTICASTSSPKCSPQDRPQALPELHVPEVCRVSVLLRLPECAM